jgi:hypothetical protein
VQRSDEAEKIKVGVRAKSIYRLTLFSLS